jgi:hypothetical protein
MNATGNRSSFVTVLAWVFIILSGFGMLISLFQNIMVWTVFNQPEVANAMSSPPPGAPPFMAFIAGYLRWIFLAPLLVTTATLVSSIGLLKRVNPARLVFIGLMILGIAWNMGGLVIQFAVFGSMREQFAAFQQSADAPNMQPFLIAMEVVSVLFAIGFSVLWGWIARRLMSREVRTEFGVAA